MHYGNSSLNTMTAKPMKENLPMQTRTKLNQIRAAAAVVLGLLLASANAQPYLMPTGPGGGKPDDGKQPFDPNPAAAGSLTKQILTYGVDKDGNAIPVKTIRITNDTDHIVYPMLRNPNTSAETKFGKISIYDPYDLPDKEYRGFIGYKGNDGKYYFGLDAGKSITLTIPLVFWNGGRIIIGTDGQYLTASKNPNPLNYDPNALRAITAAEKSPDTIPNGAIMWYRGPTPLDPAADSEDQLAEWTIRDHDYLIKVKVNGQINDAIPDNQLVTLINYDVSNVDSLYLPLALAALDSWVIPGGGPSPQRTGFKPGSHPDALGWTGAINTESFMQGKIHPFVDSPNKFLGQYFGGKGWPFYNIPNPTNDPKQPKKIPSGANVFAQSPLLGVRYSYNAGGWDSDKYMLSSGGTEAVFVGIGFAGTDSNGKDPNPAGSTTIQLAQGTPQDQINFVEPGFIVTDSNPKGSVVPNGTTVKSVDSSNKKVTLSEATTGGGNARTLLFTRPTHDYAAEAMIRLWFSWAQYYLAHWKDKNPSAPTAPKQIDGKIGAQMATLFFQQPHPELVEGMMVTGPGLNNTVGESGPHQGKAVILKISSDRKSVILSQVANATSSGSYTFSPPQEILWTPKKEGDPGFPLFGDKFQFANLPEYQDPYKFSQAVYLIMASMNQIDKKNNSDICKFMQDIIGANMAYIFDQAGKDSDDGQMVIAMIRDMIKSVLRGVYDFTKYPDKLSADGKTHLVWYPDPSKPTGGQKFNVFNLDPFVWFVHVKLGFSGYGFSVDDDTADVGAGGANHLQMTVGGSSGLKNISPWTNQTPFGPFTFQGTYVIEPGDTSPDAIKSVSNETPITVTTTGQHHLKGGDPVYIDQVNGTTAANGTFKVENVTNYTFQLFDPKTGDPVKGNGAYNPSPTPGRWSFPPSPYITTGDDLSKVYFRVAGNDPEGVFLGTIVSIDGVAMKNDPKARIRVLGKQNIGQLILTEKLKYADGTDVPAGTYKFRFSAD